MRLFHPSVAGAGSEVSQHQPNCWECLPRQLWFGYGRAIAGNDPSFQGNAATRLLLQVSHLFPLTINN